MVRGLPATLRWFPNPTTGAWMILSRVRKTQVHAWMIPRAMSVNGMAVRIGRLRLSRAEGVISWALLTRFRPLVISLKYT